MFCSSCSILVFNIDEELKGIEIKKESLKSPDFQRTANAEFMGYLTSGTFRILGYLFSKHWISEGRTSGNSRKMS